MLTYVDFKDLGSFSYTGMGNQRKNVVVSARKREYTKSQITQESTRSKDGVRVQGDHRDNVSPEAVKQIVTAPKPAGSRADAAS